MITKKISLDIPIDVSSDRVKVIVAAQLYKDGQVTLKQAADIAKVTSWDFLYILGQQKISYTNIEVDDLRFELEEFQ